MSSAAILTNKLKEERDYWHQRLSDGLGNSSLPPDFKRSKVYSRKLNTIPVNLPDDVNRRLVMFTKNSPFLVYTTLMAALKTCLWNYTGSPTIVVGSPSHRRAGDIGSGNALPIVDRMEGELSFREFLLNVRRTLSEAYEHQSYPLARMVRDLEIEEDPTECALFDIALVLGDIHHELPEVRNGITFRFNAGTGLIAGSVEYDARSFRRDTIERLTKHLLTILRAALNDVELPLSRLPLMDDDEREQLWNACNNFNRDYSPDACLIQMFEAQTVRTPDGLAVVYEDGSLTYGELNARANQVAHNLQRLGVEPECIAGLCVDRSLEMIVGMLGILKAGAAYLPLDPTLPESRLAFMLTDARASAVLTLQRHGQKFGTVSQPVICLDSDWPNVSAESCENPNSEAPPDSGAYVLFTSGSTGQPKGVMMTRRPLANLISWQLENSNTTPGARTLQFASLSFDVSFQEIFSTLCAGECLVLISEELRRDPAALWNLLGDQAVERLFLPFIYLQQLSDAAAAAEGSGGHVLRDVITAGEQLQVTPSVVELFRRLPGCLLVNQYGPTEAHVVSSFTLNGAPSRWPTLPPIGAPIANARVYLLDRHLRAVPSGVPGELYLGGVSIARCYLNRPELSAEKFVPHPYPSQGGERLYKTGDLGRYLPDGSIEYLGRMDHQVKIRGFRVEIGEIEVALNTHSAVKECAVIAREDTPGDKRLAAYVVPNREHSPSSSELRSFLKEKLPEYMVPSSFVILDRLPLTRTGKIDRKALPAPNQAPPEPGHEAARPRTHVEETLAGIWAEVLGVSKIGIYDNFFELGGDSILTIQVVARANRAGLRLAPKQLFQHQTIAALAAVAGTASKVEAEQGAVSGAVPITPIQHWLFDQELADPQHFNMGYLFEWRGAERLVPALVEQTVRRLIEHHDALRLRFKRGPDGWQQANAPADDSRFLLEVNLAGLEESEQSRLIEASASKLQATLNLSEGPILRVGLFDRGEGKPHKVLILIHHLAVDGVSWRILLEDFQTLYRQLAEGQAASLPPKTTSFKQWSERLLAHAQSDVVERELASWTGETPPFASLPVDNPQGANRESSASVVAVSLDVEETDALLRVVPKIQNLRINDVLLAALVKTFGSWTNSRSLLVDLESHGREEFAEDLDVSRTVGWFTAIAPVWLDLRAAETSAEVLDAVKAQLKRIPNRGIGYGLLRHLNGNPATKDSLRSQPRAQVSFNYLGQTDQMFTEGAMLKALGEPIGTLIAPSAAMPHLFYVAGIIHQGQLHIRFKFSDDSYERSTVEGLARDYQVHLRSLIAHCRAANASGEQTRVFPLAPMDGEQLASAFEQVRLPGGTPLTSEQVEDVYPLSPSQEGILFHSIYSPESGVYVIQMHCTFKGLDVAAAERAWQTILDRYAVLRSAFVWDNVEKPLQIVVEGLKVPWQRHDWREVSPELVPDRFNAYLDEDRNRGFDLNAPPLMRFSLIQIGEQDYKFVWSHHHLLLDGWSIFIILKEFLQLYGVSAARDAGVLPPAQPYSDYIGWLRDQNTEEAEPFWRRMLEGFTGPTPVGKQGVEPDHSAGYDEHRSLLSEATTSALQLFAKQHQLTLNTVVQGAWAMLLSHYGVTKDIVFGATASGRPSELPGVESMVGIFINVLPMRIRLDSSRRLDQWLKEIQQEQFKTRQYEYSALVQIQRWSAVPRGKPLFESILSFENYPIDSSIRQYAGDLDISEVQSISRTNYPITVVVAPRKELVLRMAYDRGRFDRNMIEDLAARFATVLQTFVERPQSSVGDIEEVLAGVDKKRRQAGQKKQEEAKRGRFKLIKPRVVSLPEEMVTTNRLGDSETLPLVIQPAGNNVNLAEWATHGRAFIESRLREHGALLFRGFNVESVEAFQEIAAVICPELFGEYGDLPREGVNGKVYRSTPYPSNERILYHNESSHMHRWPLKIWFYCVEAASRGGETPIVDCREVYRRLDPLIRQRFERKKLMYVRNYIEGLDVSWQSFFGTDERSRVESYCKSAGIVSEWTRGNGLRTTKVRSAVSVHPGTGEKIFFNQIQLHHPSCLEPSVRETLAAMFSQEDFPRNVYYGDGSPLEDSIVDEIKGLYDQVAVAFRWQEDDILMLDNMLTAHARNPYEGPRRIVVAMGELINEGDLADGSGNQR